jgi:amino acid adenylation domain-containing protein/non-ribosomal peptide synthase protein (TIGR01720 family)
MSATFVELLRSRADREPGRVAYTFAGNEELSEVQMTYRELDRQARAIAALLQSLQAQGERALLLYPHGPDYVAAFFGCLYANVTAVPAYPPRVNRLLARAQAIAADSQARFLLTTKALLPKLQEIAAMTAEMKDLQWVATDEICAQLENDWQEPQLSTDTLAFLQYTSGSTGTPKGVMVSHGNLLHNSAMLAHSFGYNSETQCVTWLPLYHDMGLIGGVLQPLFGGFHNTILSPLSFVRNPLSWLEVISRQQATLSGAPNFAYELCIRKSSEVGLNTLDLRSWKVAFTGAEPIRPDTLERFVAAFEPHGFSREAFFSCYGLAEATLIVSGGPRASSPTIHCIDRSALLQHTVKGVQAEDEKARPVVSCGRVMPGHEVLIVDPESLIACEPDMVGEVWVSSPSVAHGYWNRPDENRRLFEAKVANDHRSFLRTGDLGYQRDGELFITGRIKDLIIIRGRNYYPQDIELTVECSHPSLRPNCGAAFFVEIEHEERLVVVHEVERSAPFETVIKAIRQAVSEEHELHIHAVVLVKPKSIAKTSSGKIQRRTCKEYYLAGTLAALKIDTSSASFEVQRDQTLSREALALAPPELRQQLVEEYLQRCVARTLGNAPSTIDWEQPLSSMGLDSLMAVELENNIESDLAIALPLTTFLQDIEIAQLATQLLTELNAGTASKALLAASKVEERLAPGQRGLWFLNELQPDSAYNIVRAIRVRGSLDVAALRRAFQALIDRHASLRATFTTIDGEPVQQIRERAAVDFVEEDAGDWSEARVRDRLTEKAQESCDLDLGPLLRVSLFKRSAVDHILLMVVHHIAVDFWSLAILMQELKEHYEAERLGLSLTAKPAGFEYADFVRWQVEMLEGPEGDALWDYWQEQLAGELPVLQLPLDRPRPAVQTYRGASQQMRFDRELAQRLRLLGQSRGATLNMTLLAAFAVLLSRYAGQDDVIIGSTANCRNRPEFTDVVGYFVNTVLLRMNLETDPSFESLLSQTRTTMLGALEHQHYPYTHLVERLQPVRDPSRSPLFQAMFVMQQTQLLDEPGMTSLMLGEPGGELRWGDTVWETMALDNRVAKFDLTLMMAAVDGELAASLEYNTDLFTDATIERMFRHFEALLKDITEHPEKRLSELSLMSLEEYREVVVEWNETTVEFPSNECLHAQFERQVERTPEAIAVSFLDEHLTYAELNAQANQLAHYLRGVGVGPEVIVGICLERRPAMLVALLGVLKAGGAYLPLEASDPRERLVYMLKDARVEIVLTQETLVSVLPDNLATELCLDSDWPQVVSESVNNPSPTASPKNLAYLLYTSGSTGAPKCVMIQHESLANYLQWATREYKVMEGNGAPVHSPIGFDLTITGLFVPLLAGRRVILVPEDKGIAGLSEALLQEGNASLVKLTPSHLEVLNQLLPMEARKGLSRAFIIGGEALLGSNLTNWRQHAAGTRLINEYGPTETVVGCCVYEVSDGIDLPGAVPIGRPIANTKIYLLDKQGQPVPAGICGEIYIGGAGVARGYLNQAALTAERFVPDPFSERPGARLYRTGDQARCLSDGNLEYLGRFDTQVKVRGYRIELGEIESVLAAHPSVQESVVIAREDQTGDKRLVAYVVVAQETPSLTTQLLVYLRQRLPAYMLPEAVVVLPSLPLTANGKVDHRALPVPQDTAEDSSGSVAPLNPVEELLAGIWMEVLGRGPAGAHDDFFRLGGHSLLATRLVSRIRGLFQVEVPLQSVFEFPTLAGLSEIIETAMKSDHTAALMPIEHTPGEWEPPLSFAQQRLWLLDQLEPGNPFYNIPLALRLQGPLDHLVLQKTFSEIIRRHEVLRTNFVIVDGPPRQLIAPPRPFAIQLHDLSYVAESERETQALRMAAELARAPFNLVSDPLLRVHLLRLDQDDYLLLLLMHHIVSDGWSTSILLHEVATLYKSYSEGRESTLPELPIQYSDFASWQRRWLQGEVLEKQLSYWKQQLADPLPVLDLLTDRPRPAVQTFNGALEPLAFSRQETDLLKALSQQQKATLFMTLLAAFQVLLSRYTGQQEIVVGTPVANRTRVEIENLIGFFVNTLVLRTDLSGEPTFKEVIRRVREVCLGAHAHQDIPFEKLVAELHPERDTGRSVFFQVMFAMQNVPPVEMTLPDLTWTNVSIDSETAKFDLLLSMRETADGLVGTLQYNTDLFAASTIKRMLGHFQTLVLRLAGAPDEFVSEVSLLSEAEQHQLVVEWNETAARYPAGQTITEMFEAQVERTPQATALVCDEQELSYAELNERANQLAHFLAAQGVGAESIVALLLPRGPAMMTSLLAVLKAGGAYLPLDVNYPIERLRYALADAQAGWLLTNKELAAQVQLPGAAVICVDDDGSWREASTANLGHLANAEQLAYVIYTSGSSGEPKGVMVRQGAVVNLSWALQEHIYAGQRAGLRVALNAPLVFDSSVKQVLQLLRGHTLYLLSEEVRSDAGALLDYLEKQRVEVLDCTPSQLRVLLAEGLEQRLGQSLKVVLVGGEELAGETWEALGQSDGIEFYNVYGPTECTVDATAQRVRDEATPSIGRPLGNIEIYILDQRQQPVPPGVRGELYIGGAGLARGYLGRPELTAQRFIPHPYSKEPGARLYRTGDQARYLADGKLEYLGRLDEQVKLRGYRIELGEIEAVLMRYPDVAESAVVVRIDESGDKRLLAYVVPLEGGDTTLLTSELRRYLRQQLPDYMLPGHIMLLDRLPLTSNGKINRDALPSPPADLEKTDLYLAARTPIEELVVGAYEQVLGRTQVGVHDNFFDLGGHSLLATRLVSRLREVFEIEITLRSVFESPTVAALAELIETALLDKELLEPRSILPVARERADLPLSFAQQRLWFLDQLEPGNPFYNIPIALRLTGELEIPALEQTLSQIISRHESLRTSFVVKDSEPVQVIASAEPWPILVEDLSGLEESERELEAARRANEEACRPFDLSCGPLLRMRLLRLGDKDHVVVLTMHHIISDGWSMGVFLREVAAFYTAYIAGEEFSMPELSIQYADFTCWQREWLQGEVLERQLDYWKQQLAGPLPVLALPADRPRPPVQTYCGAQQSLFIPQSDVDRFRELSRREGATLFMALLASFQTLLYRYTGQDDVIVGTAVAGRNLAVIEPLMGFFANTLVLRTDLSGPVTFTDVLRRVREVCLGAYAHQDLPFERLVEELHPERELSRSPLFQTMFLLQNFPLERLALALPNLELSPMRVENGSAKVDLMINVTEEPDGVCWTWIYNTDLFDDTTIRRMISHTKVLLESILDQPQQSISTYSLMPADEYQQVLIGGNGASNEYRSDRCIHEIFEEQVLLTPYAKAIVYENEYLTYEGLNARANQLARYLRTLGVGPDVLVGICVERSLEMLIGLLGIMKAGGAYLPLDPTYPEERLAFMMEDASVGVLLTQRHLLKDMPGSAAKTVCLDSGWDAIATESKQNLTSDATAENLAYVIYTSGSTGRPKGVMVCHRSVINLVEALCPRVKTAEPDIWTLVHSYSFDFSVWEIWGALLSGAQLNIVPFPVTRNPEAMETLVNDRRVTVLNQTPSALAQLLGERDLAALESSAAALNVIVVGGEALPQELANKLAGANIATWNFYGPTEATVWTTVQPIQNVETATFLGRPLTNAQVYVLDRQQQLAPVGVPGELHISGAGLARGYWQRPELTAEKFIPNPYSGEAGARLYRTGDLARFLPDGQLQFLGRVDAQVKVRGYRIELGEIEAVLSQHELIRECVVIAREDEPGDKRLIAYLVKEGEAVLPAKDLRRFLKQRLPEYMVPSSFIELESLPLTRNGKLDRQSLPAPEQSLSVFAEEYVASRTPVEDLLTGIWAEVLSVEQVGVHDSFFDLGGHSLLATQLISRVRELFKAEIGLRSLFEFPTVAGLAEVIETALRAEQGVELEPVLPVDRDHDLPLSFAQQRMWFLNQLEPDNPSYNIPVAVRLIGKLNITALAETLSEIVSRHEVLRTIIPTVNGQPVQVILTAQPIRLQVEDLSALNEGERQAEVERRTREEAGRAFHLSVGPLLRVRLLRLGQEEHVVLLTMHHIVSDGWSMGVLIKEVASLYASRSLGEDATLSELPIQYADYAIWQRNWLQGDLLEKQLTYWRQQLGAAPPILQLPTDYPRPAILRFRGASEPLVLSPGITTALKEISRRERVTLFMTVLASWQTLLSRYTGQDDIIVGMPISNRTRTEIEGLIGLFANTVVMRTDISGDDSFTELLSRVREVCLSAYAHQDVPFEKLVDELQPERALNRNPLFQTALALQNAPKGALELPGLTLSSITSDSQTSQFDLTLSLVEAGDQLVGTVEYSTELFEAATIRRLIGHFQTLLEGIAANPEQQVAMLPLMNESERHQLLVEWNQTATEYRRENLLHKQFEKQAAETPEAAAVIYEDQVLNYAELNTRANQLAHYLRELSVGPETLVGLYVERSIEMVVGMLGILKAGGAYVPLDPGYPTERLAFLLADAEISVVVTKKHLKEGLSEQNIAVVSLDTEWEEISTRKGHDYETAMSPDHPAYVIYTSGSTGTPKGVMITHRSIVNHMSWMQESFPLTASDRVLQKTPFTFDASVWEFFAPLLAGAQLVMARPGGHQEGAYLVSTIMAYQITTLQLVPTLLRLLVAEPGLDQCRSLRRVFMGGEELPRSLAHDLNEQLPDLRIYNMYGPTEATIEVTYGPYVDGATAGMKAGVPIGRPIPNTCLYVLDQRQQLVPVGVAGELYIGGVAVARGYLRRPELTAERFIPDEFSGAGGRLYRTGDLVRYLADGQMEYLGRLDAQVKMRGYRIELGEIEALLTQHPLVRDAVISVWDDSAGEEHLVAYVTSHREAPEQGSLLRELAAELRSYLKERLPEYMVPSNFVQLDALPLTRSGKVDRQALPAPEVSRDDLGSEYVAPRNRVEEVLIGIWSKVLGIEKVGVNDNFFELGGDSILSLQIVARAKQAGLALTPELMFRHQSISTMAAAIESDGAGLLPAPSEQGIVTGEVLLTPVQSWFLNHPMTERHHFNQSLLLEVPERVEAEILERAIDLLISHHDALRLRFVEAENGQWRQFIVAEETHQVFSCEDLGQLEGDEAEVALEMKSSALQASLDLVDGPILRAALFRMGRGRPARLLLVVHHLAVDGVSWRILVEDLHRACDLLERSSAELALPEKTTSYKRWAQALYEYAQGSALTEEIDYWREVLRKEVELLPLDLTDGANLAGSARTIVKRLTGEETTALLQEVPEVYHTQINDLLLAALTRALSGWTGSHRHRVNLEGHGRESVAVGNGAGLDLSRTVGWFTTIYPVLLEVRSGDTPDRVLLRIKEQLRKVPQRGLGFGLIRYLREQHLGQPALAFAKEAAGSEISFNYLGQFDQLLGDAPEWRAAARQSVGRGVSEREQRRYLLEIVALISGGELIVQWSYNTQLHLAETIEGLAERYITELRELIAHCLSAGAGGYTPSDFSLAGLDEQKLDRIMDTVVFEGQ